MSFDAYEAVRKHELEKSSALIRKLSQEDPRIQQELLWFFWLLDSSVFFPKNRQHLTLVSDQTSNTVSQLVGVPVAKNIVTRHQKTLQHSGSMIIGVNHTPPDPKAMSELELEIYFSGYFNDTATRNTITKLFMRERAHQSFNSTLNLHTSRDVEKKESDEDGTLHNTHSLWLTLESVGEDGRRFTLKYDYEKVQKKHKSPKGETQTGDAQIVEFPKTPKPHNEEVPSTPVEEKKDGFLVYNTLEMCEKVFISSMIYLSHFLENLEWFLGVRKEIFIPQEVASQLERLRELEIFEWFFNYHEHIESTLASMIAYYSPVLVGSLSEKRKQSIKKVPWETYPKRKDIPLADATPKVKKEEPENTVHLEMHPEMAARYGFSVPAKIDCTPKFIEHFFSLADNDPVIFQLEGKQVEITAKIFRRIFHRESVPPETEGDDNVIYTK